MDQISPRARVRRFARLSSAFSALSDAAVASLLRREPLREGWGATATIEFDGERVFVKRLPVTDVEMAHPYSTKDRYRLPVVYQYGVGSAGFGALRELLTYVKTTNWVLDGSCASFPMMFHHRIVPSPNDTVAHAGIGVPGDPRHEAYIASWRGSAAISRFMVDRRAATHEILVMLEWFPATLGEHLIQRPAMTERAVGQLLDTVAFLRENGVLHFDAHYNNVVTDGRSVYLTDHGLAIDRTFELNAGQRRFFGAHQHYDLGLPIRSLFDVLGRMIDRLGPRGARDLFARHGIGEGEPPLGIGGEVLDRIEAVVADRALRVHPSLARALIRYRDVIADVAAFHATMRNDPRKRSTYDDGAFAQLLRSVGVPSDVAGSEGE